MATVQRRFSKLCRASGRMHLVVLWIDICIRSVPFGFLDLENVLTNSNLVFSGTVEVSVGGKTKLDKVSEQIRVT
jgi:hypothetical protein